jgi:hypothetical protein
MPPDEPDWIQGTKGYNLKEVIMNTFKGPELKVLSGLVELKGDIYPLAHHQWAGTGVYSFQYFMRHSSTLGGSTGRTLYLSSGVVLKEKETETETGTLVEGQVELKAGDWAYFQEISGGGCAAKAYLVKITEEWEESPRVRGSLLWGEGLDPHEWGPHPTSTQSK